LEKVGQTRDPNFCGSCYGGVEPEGGCCNTCESVRQAYLNRGWAFSDPDAVEQCVAEHWTDRIKEQMNEGCNLSGRIRVKKVASNLQLSPGRSYQANTAHSHDLVPYLRGDGQTHDFGHMIHHLRFESDDEYDASKVVVADRIRRRLGVDSNPLDATSLHFGRWKRVCIAPAFSIELITLSH
jgi:endoplasmic reticulum-Golgi intermediate compartment protein 3